MLPYKYYAKFRTRTLLFCLLIVFQFTVFSASPATEDRYRLTGTVFRDNGLPFGDLELLLFRHTDTFRKSPPAICITESDGSFGFNAAKGESYILEVRGELGNGRVFIPAGNHGGNPSARLDITYPVTEEIVILHTNDQHFTLNKPLELSKKISEIREKYENVYLFNAGDIFVRHPLRWIVNGQFMRDPAWYGERAMLMISYMNELGYDLMTPGNHELAYREPYTRLALEAADFPMLAANMEITTDALPAFDDYAILNTSTMRKIAVLGLTTGDAPHGVRELDLAATVRDNLFLKDSSDILIALSHLGLRTDRSLAEEFPEFDVIIGGHSHDVLKEAIMVNSVLVAQAGGNPHIVSDTHPVYLGKIIITLENGIIREKRGWVMTISLCPSEVNP
jgi:hypothetical protein